MWLIGFVLDTKNNLTITLCRVCYPCYRLYINFNTLNIIQCYAFIIIKGVVGFICFPSLHCSNIFLFFNGILYVVLIFLSLICFNSQTNFLQLLIVFFIDPCVPVLTIFLFCSLKTFHIFKSYRDKDFARLAQLIVDYENPLKKLVEDYAPHNRVSQFSFIYCCFGLNFCWAEFPINWRLINPR